MVTLTIDGVEVTVAADVNLVQAAAEAGIEIPTYCYHPGLSVVGQCRICFVEVEGMPRLVTACSTPVQPEMKVHTDTDRVIEARAAVMEFLLENHPLDCPVCDQAGECGLQDYSVEHGLDTTHMVDKRRTYPGFERRKIGPHVVQNQNRCIHCTRCIRFTHEIAETGDLTMKSRGNHSYIDTFDGQPLDNPWSACVADVCPVGALTVEEFRFRARVWHLEETESICPGCSIGCNVLLGHLDATVHRFVPRENVDVNGWWMCDYGRFLADGLNRRDIDRPLLRTESGEQRVTWQAAISEVASWLLRESKPLVLASADFSNETLYAIRRHLVDRHQLEVVVPVFAGEVRSIKNGHGEWISSVDSHSNSTGARRLGLNTVDVSAIDSLVSDHTGRVLVLDAHAAPWLMSDGARHLAAGRSVAVLARYHTPLVDAVSIVLPLASWAETEGTYTSSTGRVQFAARALPPRGQARPAWSVVNHLAFELGEAEEPETSPRALFTEMAASMPAFAGMTWRRLATEGSMPIHEEVRRVD
jgi:NADH-quinone oxidoreductase subunit G